jgi:hypothetical protein
VTASVRAALVTAASALVAVAAVSRTPQSLYGDQAVQFKTVQQRAAGVSPQLNTWVRPDYHDLSRDAPEPLIVWAPGTPIAAALLIDNGATVAVAARSIAIVALLAGSVGWVLWFTRFGLHDRVVLALAVLLPWVRYASNNLFWYSSEMLVFAAVPWVLLAALAAARRDKMLAWAAVGLLAGSLYVVKYSASFVTFGLMLWLAWRAWRERGRAIGALVAAAAAAAAPMLALTLFNRAGGGANLLSTSTGMALDWRFAVHALGLPALAVGDLDAVLRFLLMHPTHGMTRNGLWVSAIGVPGGLLLMALAARGAVEGSAAALARTVFAASVASIAAVWTMLPSVSTEARLLAAAGFCVLPLAMAEGSRWWRASRAPWRAALVAASIVYVAVPLAYGPVSVAAKIRRTPADYRAAASGIYNPLLAEHDLQAVVTRFERDFDGTHDVWYLVDGLSTLDLRGRAIVRDADFMTLDELRRDRFVASRPLRIHVLMPARFESNGKGDAIRAAFPQAVSWRRDAVPGSQYDRWIAELQVGRDERVARAAR